MKKIRELSPPVLSRLGIDPRQFWLLVDLFSQLSDRREILSGLGRDGVSLQVVAGFYFVLASGMSALLVAGGVPAAAYTVAFLAMTAFILLMVLIAETSNSLVNPVEGLVLAHQPINGATYIAAKLIHLAWIVLYLVAALNIVPALAGLALKETGRWYPLVHLLGAFAVGMATALVCCAIFGWLIRLVPATRLKAAGQLAEAASFGTFILLMNLRQLLGRFAVPAWLPAGPEARIALALVLGGLIAVGVVQGIRCLSADYLIRVSGIVHGRRKARGASRWSWWKSAVGRRCGGPEGLAGYEFTGRMMLRDYQFRRAWLTILQVAILGAAAVGNGLRTAPFSGGFTTMHFLPHALGALLCFACVMLAYGNDYKGAWMFGLAPDSAIGRFARGVHAVLWVRAVAAPHMLLFPLLAWRWGIMDAALFLAYSAALASAYLALEMRLIDGVPFAKQADAARGALLLPLMILGGLAMGAVVALQYFLVFHSRVTVLVVTLALGAVAVFLTRSSLGAFADTMRFHLNSLSGEGGNLYHEVET